MLDNRSCSVDALICARGHPENMIKYLICREIMIYLIKCLDNTWVLVIIGYMERYVVKVQRQKRGVLVGLPKRIVDEHGWRDYELAVITVLDDKSLKLEGYNVNRIRQVAGQADRDTIN